MSLVPQPRFPLILLAAILLAAPAAMAQIPNTPAVHDKILGYVRHHFNIPDSVKMTMTDLRESAFQDFYETTVTVDNGKDKQSQPMFVAKNMRYVVEGTIFNMGGDSHQEIERLISLRDAPSQGPADAPVTLVEYSDLECPVCARFQDELETEIVPKYGNKLRVVFKEFPLVTIHDWALTGAIAAQCVYQVDPADYVAFRTAVYKNQESVNAEHARDQLLHFGAEAGVDNMKLAACIDARSSLGRVDANIEEGYALGINQTPTSYVNGRLILGAEDASEVDKLIDEAMHDAR